MAADLNKLFDRSELNYAGIKAAAEALGPKRPMKTLIVTQSDPFTAGAPQRRKMAEWVVELWRRFKIMPGAHLRRVHYVLVSQKPAVMVPLRHVGGMDFDQKKEPYLNTERCQQIFNDAACDARYLGLINAEDLIDRRNADPIIYLPSEEETDATVAIGGKLSCEPVDLEIPELGVTAPCIHQGYHIEIWAEKTTMNDILLPLCQQYHINLITGLGEMSITRCNEAVARAKRSGLPLRILYLSDFDPGGISMPTAVARKIEFELRTKEHDLDIQVRPILLTKEQCEFYELPRIPIKDKEKRKGAFEERHGEGAVELDALEALRPDELARLLTVEILRYFDAGLERRIKDKVREVDHDLEEINAEVHKRHRKDIAKVKAARKKLTAAQTAFKKTVNPLFAKIKKSLNAEAPEMADYEWPKPKPGDEDPDPLFDSTRTYLEQVDRYKRHQGKLTTRKKSKPREKKIYICVNPECPRPNREFLATQPANCCCSACRNKAHALGAIPKKKYPNYYRTKVMREEQARTGIDPKPGQQKIRTLTCAVEGCTETFTVKHDDAADNKYCNKHRVRLNRAKQTLAKFNGPTP